jgi:myosin-5
MADTLSSGVAQAVQVFSKDTKAWFEDEDEAWVSASVISKEESATGVKILFQDDKDEGRVNIYKNTKLFFLKKNQMTQFCFFSGTCI